MTPSSEARPAGGGEGSQPLSAADVASLVGGRLVGDGGRIVTGLAPLDRAGPDQLSFLAAERYAAAFAHTRAGVVLVSPALESVEGSVPTRIIVERPHDAVLALIARLHRPPLRVPGVHATAIIGRGARIGDGVSIDAYAVIGDGAILGDRVAVGPHSFVGAGVKVGDDSELVASVTLYPGTELGHRVIVHAGARIGSDGFGYVFRDGAHQKIPHVGRCLVGDDVEIGANTTVDRGSIDDTVIGAGTKVDNLVQIAHNVRIGRLCLIVSQAGIAGSVRVEDGCVIAGQVGISGHNTIGKGAKVAAQAGVFGDVPPGETWSGYPARPHREALRAQAALFKLPKMIRRLEQLAEEPTSER